MQKLQASQLPRIIKSNLEICAVFVLAGIVGLCRPGFLSAANLNNLLDLSSILIISALGFSFVVECGMIDLSIEANMAFAGIVLAKIMMSTSIPWPAALAAGVLASAFLGLVNGLTHTMLKIPTFLTTLGMSYIASGLSTIITEGQYLPFAPGPLRTIAVGRAGIVPYTMLVAAAMMALVWYLTEKTPLGRHVLAVGGDEGIAGDVGIQVKRVKIISFVLAGAMFGLAGCLLSLKLGAGDSFSAVGYTFDTLSACVVGGISISGGIGKMHKAVAGAILIKMVRAAMTFFVVSSDVQEGVLGIIILVTVFLTIERKKILVLK